MKIHSASPTFVVSYVDPARNVSLFKALYYPFQTLVVLEAPQRS